MCMLMLSDSSDRPGEKTSVQALRGESVVKVKKDVVGVP